MADAADPSSPRANGQAGSSTGEEQARFPARGHDSERARRSRVEFLRERTGALLSTFEESALEASTLSSNIESLIGTVAVPVGIAGPLRFNGQTVSGDIYLPIATTEGNLVTSATRGALAITRSGGVTAHVIHQRMTRAPLFVFGSLGESQSFSAWIGAQLEGIREQVRQVSSHARLIRVEPLVLGKTVHVRFVYETGDAAGQNMTTTSTWHACQWLIDQLAPVEGIALEKFFIEGNLTSDKKLNLASVISGRGVRVVAECNITERVLRRVLKVTGSQLLESHLWSMDGAAQAGMIGYNVNVANIIAGVFVATGQDVASVHESGVGYFSLHPAEDGLYAKMLLPSLIIGTVGGGTGLPAQGELLDMMGCAGTGALHHFAEVIAAYCLALDLSTCAAVTSGQFALAHERVARMRKVRWLTEADFDAEFFARGLRQTLGDSSICVDSVEPLRGVELGSSIITALTSRNVAKLIGHFPTRLRYHAADGPARDLDVMVKVKPTDTEVIQLSNAMAGMCGDRLRTAYTPFKHRTGFALCHTRELAIYDSAPAPMRRYLPEIYGTYRDEQREAYVVVMELLDGMVLMDSADDPSGWDAAHIHAALAGIAHIHAIWYERDQELLQQPWLGPVLSASAMMRMTPLWRELIQHAAAEFPELYSDEDVAFHNQLVDTLPYWWSELEEQPRTLIHNDFNLRNIALRDDDGELRLVAYDWELATLQVPQHDLAELLAFTLPPDATRATVDLHIEHHRRALASQLGRDLDAEAWRQGAYHCFKDLLVNRFALYMMAHTFRHYGFAPRVLRSLRNLVRITAAA